MGGRERSTAKSSIGGRGRTGPDATVRHGVPTAIDLFAGAGGFSLGLRRAGFDVVLANEYSVDAEWTYRHNILGDTPEGVFSERPDDPSTDARKAYRAGARRQLLKDREALPQDFERHMRGGDITEALPDRWLRTWLERRPADVDVLVAGPPCQGFSCAGKAYPDDERNLLVHEAIRVISVVQPRIAILENVPGMLERHADLIREIGLGLSWRGKNRHGYYVFAEIVPRRTPRSPADPTTPVVRRSPPRPRSSQRMREFARPLVPGRLSTQASNRRSAPRSGGSGGVFSDRQGSPRRSGGHTGALRDRKELDPSRIGETGGVV